jgi:hypothetical protein
MHDPIWILADCRGACVVFPPVSKGSVLLGIPPPLRACHTAKSSGIKAVGDRKLFAVPGLLQILYSVVGSESLLLEQMN